MTDSTPKPVVGDEWCVEKDIPGGTMARTGTVLSVLEDEVTVKFGLLGERWYEVKTLGRWTLVESAAPAAQPRVTYGACVKDARGTRWSFLDGMTWKSIAANDTQLWKDLEHPVEILWDGYATQQPGAVTEEEFQKAATTFYGHSNGNRGWNLPMERDFLRLLGFSVPEFPTD